MNWVRNTRATGIGFALLGGAMLALALSMEGPRHMAYGPGVFPSAIGTLMLIGGVLVALRGEPADAKPPGALLRPGHIAPFAMFAAAPFVFALLLPILGFLIAAPPLIAVLVVVSGGRWTTAIVTGLLSTALLQTIFQQVMRVPLPWGLLEPYAGVLTWM